METVRKYLEDGDGVVEVGEFRMDSDTDGEIECLGVHHISCVLTCLVWGAAHLSGSG